MNIAIVAKDFSTPTQTFVANHVRELSPGHTVLISYAGRPQKFAHLPFFHIRPIRPLTRQWIVRRLRRLPGWFLRESNPWAPSSSEKQRMSLFLQSHGVRHILSEFGPTGLMIDGIAQSLGIPHSVHFHGYDASQLLRSRSYVRELRKLFNNATWLIAPSRYLANRLISVGAPPRKTVVIPFGVTVSQKSKPRSRDIVRFLSVGRLVDKKAPVKTLLAFAELATVHNNVEMVIVGAGPLEKTCRETVQQLGLAKKVNLLGEVEHDRVLNLMSEADVFVQHSVTAPNGDEEGLPVSILEAMASGLPVISTKHSGIPEAVVDGETGFLVDEGDVSAMAAKMGLLVAQPELIDNLGQRGQLRAKQYFSQSRSLAALRRLVTGASIEPMQSD